MTLLSRIVCSSCNNRLLFRKIPGNKTFYRSIRQKREVRKDGGMNLAPEQFVLEAPRENNMWPGLFKSYCFSVGLCSTVFTGAMIYEYESFRKKIENKSILNWANDKWNNLEGWKEKQGDLRQHLNMWWNSLSHGEKIFWPIFGLNGVVLACWRHPHLQKYMFKYFCNNPAAKSVCWPLLLSTFSHYSLFHFGANMYVLHSFCSTTCKSLGPEQFIAMYICGGVFSSLMSSTFKVASRSIGMSIGASGAIMALLGYFCIKYPEAELGIVFIPQYTFYAENAIKCIMALDLAGMVFRWRLFDHAAHLGGAAFGVLYALYGQKLYDKRKPYIKKWHEFRNSIEVRGKDD